MSRDQYEGRPQPPLVAPAMPTNRYLLFCGVAVACVLGGGLGLWARPGLSERNALPVEMQPAPVAAATQPHRLQIVVDHPPGDQPPPARVQKAAVVEPATPVILASVPAPARAEPASPRTSATVQPPPARIYVRVIPPPPKPHLVKIAALAKTAPKAIRKVQRLAPKAVRLIPVKSARPAPKPKLQMAKVAAVKAPVRLVRTARLTARPIHAPRLEKVRLVQPPKARARRAEPPKVQKVVAIVARPAAHKAAKHIQASRPTRVPAPAVARPVGLMKVANTSRCASADPGAAAVCASPSLGAADRQLSRAYRDAQAAGVPSWQLQRQQQHWLAARTAAAREAPWAVHDVYQARIAQLNGMAQTAQAGPGF